MRTRVYVYVDGVMTPAWQDHGEGYARMPGHGGELVKGVSEVAKDRIRRDGEREQSRKVREANTCGFLMPLAGEPCARKIGHKVEHATRASLDHKAGWV